MIRTSCLRLLTGVAVAAAVACAPPPPPGAVYVMRGPPGEVVEVIPTSPGPEYVWVRAIIVGRELSTGGRVGGGWSLPPAITRGSPVTGESTRADGISSRDTGGRR